MPSVAGRSLRYQAKQGDQGEGSGGRPGRGREGWGKFKTRPRQAPKITGSRRAPNQTGSQIIRGVERLSPHQERRAEGQEPWV